MDNNSYSCSQQLFAQRADVHSVAIIFLLQGLWLFNPSKNISRNIFLRTEKAMHVAV